MVAIGRLHPEVIKICRPLIVEDQVLRLCVKKFAEFAEKSLAADTAHRSTVKCTRTFIADFPDGSERGSAIGLDISGKVFRLVHVTFRGDRTHTATSRLYEVPEAKLRGSGYRVVEYVARCVANFMETTDIRGERVILGVSVGFPMEQNSLQSAQLLRWSDDFRCEDFINEDFFTQLKIALKKYKVARNLYLIAATSDAASSLLAGLYRDSTARIGIVVGDQVKLCYLEKQDNISVFPGDGLRPRAAVGMDFRSFGDDGCLDFIKTEFDHQIDANSDTQGRYTLDKLISGQYLGEIFRLCLVKLIQGRVILRGVLKPKMTTPGCLKTEDILHMESEEESTFKHCKSVLRRLGYQDPPDDDCCQVRFVARCVAKRSANLVAAFLAAVAGRLDMREVQICADGHVVRRSPHYFAYLQKKFGKLRKAEVKAWVSLNEKEDLGVGAGLLAFIYKDGVIRVEEKHRVLPPMREVVSPCRDCEQSCLM